MHGACLILSISILLVLAGFNHAHGLTTFGKTQSNTNQAPPAPPAKSCNQESDCLGIQNASCVPDPRDSKRTKCLCGDNTPPINGACNSKYKGPGHSCTSNTECTDNSECMEKEAPGSRNPMKICKCMEGYTEEHSQCNGAKQLSVTSGIIMIVFARFLY